MSVQSQVCEFRVAQVRAQGKACRHKGPSSAGSFVGGSREVDAIDRHAGRAAPELQFKRLSGRQETGEKFAAEMTEAMQEAGNAMEALDGKVSKFGTEQQDLRKKLEEHLEAFAKFREKVEKTDSNPNKRPLNTGGAGYEKADC